MNDDVREQYNHLLINRAIDKKINEIARFGLLIFSILGSVLAFLGYNELNSVGVTARQTARDVIKEETRLAVIDTLRQRENEILLMHANASSLLSQLEDDTENLERDIKSKLIIDRTFSKLVASHLRDGLLKDESFKSTLSKNVSTSLSKNSVLQSSVREGLIPNLISNEEFNETFISRLSDYLTSKPEYRSRLKGEKGDRGDTGASGIDGKDGTDGEDGADGFPENLVYGSVSANGDILSGTGFTVTKSELGRYQISFDRVFPKSPLFIATGESHPSFDSGITISIAHGSKTPSKVVVETLLGKNNNFVDANWQFIAFTDE